MSDDFSALGGGSPLTGSLALGGLIAVLQANQMQMSALLKTLNTTLAALPVNVAPAYATGTWTPADASGAALAFTSVSANYTQVGRIIMAYATFAYPVTADGSNASISGLPVNTANAQFARGPAKVYCSAAVDVILRPAANAATAAFLSGATGAAVINSALSGATVSFTLVYPTS